VVVPAEYQAPAPLYDSAALLAKSKNDTHREAGDLDEQPVEACTGVHRSFGVVTRSTNRDVGTESAVFGLRTGVSRDVATVTGAIVARRAIGFVTDQRAVRHVAGVVITVLHADPAADLDAGIGARDVIEPRTIQTTNLHVLDRLGLDGKIGSLRPSNRNETRCTAEEKAFHHLHIEPPNIVSLLRGFRIRLVRQHRWNFPLLPAARKTYRIMRSTQL